MSSQLETTTPAPSGTLASRQVTALVVVLSLGIFMSSLDLFIVNLAFPYIGREYAGTSLSTLSWVLNSYAIVFAAVLVPAGRWADRDPSPRSNDTKLGKSLSIAQPRPSP